MTADGLEHTFAVNHLAAFLLTDLLLERLKASAPARVVTVSSGAQSMGTIDFDDLQGERVYSGETAYNQSKLASVMFTYELARRLEGTGVTATVLHPGVVNTAFGAEDPSRIFKVIVPFVRPFMKSPSQGAATSIYLASSPAVEGITGTYFVNSKPKASNGKSYDEEAASRLWRISAGLVGMAPAGIATASLRPRRVPASPAPLPASRRASSRRGVFEPQILDAGLEDGVEHDVLALRHCLAPFDEDRLDGSVHDGPLHRERQCAPGNVTDVTRRARSRGESTRPPEPDTAGGTMSAAGDLTHGNDPDARTLGPVWRNGSAVARLDAAWRPAPPARL